MPLKTLTLLIYKKQTHKISLREINSGISPPHTKKKLGRIKAYVYLPPIKVTSFFFFFLVINSISQESFKLGASTAHKPGTSRPFLSAQRIPRSPVGVMSEASRRQEPCARQPTRLRCPGTARALEHPRTRRTWTGPRQPEDDPSRTPDPVSLRAPRRWRHKAAGRA